MLRTPQNHEIHWNFKLATWRSVKFVKSFGLQYSTVMGNLETWETHMKLGCVTGARIIDIEAVIRSCPHQSRANSTLVALSLFVAFHRLGLGPTFMLWYTQHCSVS